MPAPLALHLVLTRSGQMLRSMAFISKHVTIRRGELLWKVCRLASLVLSQRIVGPRFKRRANQCVPSRCCRLVVEIMIIVITIRPFDELTLCVWACTAASICFKNWGVAGMTVDQNFWIFFTPKNFRMTFSVYTKFSIYPFAFQKK